MAGLASPAVREIGTTPVYGVISFVRRDPYLCSRDLDGVVDERGDPVTTMFPPPVKSPPGMPAARSRFSGSPYTTAHLNEVAGV